ncbi:hypothetical protein FPQ18DRAFT_390057 [Pyronema domesticum]|nr:hypothetical protein FPQ18DRAFT_390057 [Pyronema domesticum]
MVHSLNTTSPRSSSIYPDKPDVYYHMVSSGWSRLLHQRPGFRWAITNHRHSTLRLLLDHGSGYSSDGESIIKTYLSHSIRVGAARRDGDTSITVLLLDYWKYPEILERNKQGFCNPLHRIIEDVYTIEIEDQPAIEPWVRLLVERGWEVDSRNRYMRKEVLIIDSTNSQLGKPTPSRFQTLNSRTQPGPNF